MRTQIAKTGYLPAEYIPLAFWLVPPPPIPQVHRGGCYREKFFLFFCDFVLIRIHTRFYSEYLRFNSFIFARYYLDYDFWLFFWFSTRNFNFIFLLVSSYVNFDLFQHCLFYALTLQLFISLTLLLVINKHLCLYEFVLCLFWLF